MVRVKQFADDLAISKNQAQTLINKGRNRKDGGSQILESVMSDKDKKKKKKTKKLKPQIMPRIEGRGRYTPVDDLPQAMPRIEGRGRYTPDDKPPSFSLKDLKEMGIDPRTMSKGGSNVVLPKKRPTSIKKKKTSEQIIREKNEYDITKSDITESLDKEFSRKVAKQNEEAMKNVKKTNKKKDGGLQDVPSNNKGLPNLPTAVRNKMGYKKDGGVLKMSRGGGIAIQGLGFKGVR